MTRATDSIANGMGWEGRKRSLTAGNNELSEKTAAPRFQNICKTDLVTKGNCMHAHAHALTRTGLAPPTSNLVIILEDGPIRFYSLRARNACGRANYGIWTKSADD